MLYMYIHISYTCIYPPSGRMCQSNMKRNRSNWYSHIFTVLNTTERCWFVFKRILNIVDLKAGDVMREFHCKKPLQCLALVYGNHLKATVMLCLFDCRIDFCNVLPWGLIGCWDLQYRAARRLCVFCLLRFIFIRTLQRKPLLGNNASWEYPPSRHITRKS